MARLAVRRPRSPDSDSEDRDSSRAQTPLSTAPNDRKRARRSTRNHDESESSAEDSAPPSTRPQTTSTNPSLSQVGTTRDIDHQPGTIVRVKLTNFVTYSKAEFFPGPSLNMVIGPNGTGKSTLVCAICLGLGWGTQVLGRGKDAGEFVKHGEAEAFIEIELKREPGRRRNPVIRRRIKKDGNKSDWWLNNEPSGQHVIKTMATSKFNIHLDNLCQFLPQDKVVEFAQMDPKDVLRSTQEAAGNARMIECHDALIKMRSTQRSLLAGQRTDKDELDNLMRRQEAQRAEVERVRDREKFKEKMQWLEKGKLIPDFYTAKRTASEAKDTQQQLHRDLTLLKKESEPILRQLSAKQIYRREVNTLKMQRETELKDAELRAGQAEENVAALQIRTEDTLRLIDSDKNLVAEKKPKLAQERQSLARLKYAREKPAPELDAPAMNSAISERRRESEELGESKSNAKQRIKEMERQREVRRKQIVAKENNIKALDTEAGQLEGRLEALSGDTVKAWRWIKENQHLFEKPIFGPPAIVCNLRDPSMAPAIESILTKSDLCLITAQTKNDYELLQNKLVKENKLHDISLRVRLDASMGQYRNPYTPQELQQFGLSSFAIDHIEGPELVLAVLCSERTLHLAAIAAGRLSSDQHSRLMNSRISGYFSENTVHQFVRRNDLGQSAAISRSSRAQPPKIWTDQPVDLGRKAAMQREVGELRGELDDIESGIQDCEKEVQAANDKIELLNAQIEVIQKEKTEKQKALTEWNGLPIKIRNSERIVADLNEFITSSRSRRDEWKAQREDLMVERAEATVSYADAVRGVKECMMRLIESEVQLIEAASDDEVLSERNKAIKALLDLKTQEEQEAREKSKAAVLRVRQLMKAASKVKEDADALKEAGKPGLLELMERMSTEQWTPADYEAEVEAVNAQLALTEGGNADAIRIWEERQKKIEQLNSRVQSSAQELEQALQAIQEVRREWEPELEQLVAQISDAFAESFARIGCAGQVEVGKKHSEATEDCTEEAGGIENGLDFANWTIRISVKFRENEPLSLLDSKRQSGGERAVSTIFYLMALQSLSRAPFRVVDEINQGMDGRNERMVHGRMVDVATAKNDGSGAGGSQYFLITPKLLSGLKYKRGMTVLCIVSGEHVPAEGERVADDAEVPFKTYPILDFKQLARKAKELRLGAVPGSGAATARRVDSGVAMVGA